MTGTLFLLPNRISESDKAWVIPELVKAKAQTISYFLVEAAKTARAYFKVLEHPQPIAELNIVEIGHDPDTHKIDEWLKPLLEGQDAAIVSESGCPGVADPGATIVARAQSLGIRVIPLTGPSSILLTLMASGLDGQHFRFLGYLPIDKDERALRIKSLEKASQHGETELFIETPYRNTKMLEALLEHLSASTRLCVATDITGQGESIRTLTLAQWRALPLASRQLPKLPTVFAFLSAQHPKKKI